MAIIEREDKINICIYNKSLKQEKLSILGYNHEEKGNLEPEVNERIGKAMRMYYAMNRSIIDKKEISKGTKTKIYKTVFRPIFTYGCESWIITNKLRSKIQTPEMKRRNVNEGGMRR